MRAVSQSLAREFGPQGVHVAHAMIDGLIDTPVTRAWGNSSEPDSMIQPDAVSSNIPGVIKLETLKLSPC